MKGIINLKSSHQELDKKIQNMKSSLLHRGPDDQGFFIDPDFSIAFGDRVIPHKISDVKSRIFS